ncbi:MAG: FAD-binding protein [Eggerthellaceae bacterium]|nr:FAD-binding protein [Eggerthellaceae bacterium]
MDSLTRRSFLGGMGALAAIGAMGMAGCKPKAAEETQATSAEGEAPAAPAHIDEVMDCDIVVVGAGCSGLAACVQAADKGAKVICLEATAIAGGGAGGVEGLFAVGSSLQKQQGIHVSVGELVRTELVQNQYRNDSLVLKDLIRTSGEDIDWLAEHGVLFGTVDNYVGFHPIFHWFQTLSGAKSYIPQMQAAAEKAGVQFVFNTHADSLAFTEDGEISGVYATGEGKRILQVNAKAVILATGGFCENPDLMEKVGFRQDNLIAGGMFGDGSGYAMATSAGAAGNIDNAGFLGGVTVPGLPLFYEGGYFCSVMNPIANVPTVIWVDGNGERIVNEDLSIDNHMISVNLGKTQDAIFILLDQAMMDAYVNGNEQGLKELDEALSKGIFVKAEGWEALAKALNMDSRMLADTIATYNGYCAEGQDEEFNKSPEYLKPYATEGTVYAIRTKVSAGKSVGAVKTDRSFCVTDQAGKVIPRLYAIGTEGAMIWANVYTMNISGSCGAHNVYSGRTAALHALSNCL